MFRHRTHAETAIRVITVNGKKNSFRNYRWDIDFCADIGTRTVRQDAFDLAAVIQRDRLGF